MVSTRSHHLSTNWGLVPGDEQFHKTKSPPSPPPTIPSWTWFSCFNSTCFSDYPTKTPQQFLKSVSAPGRGRTVTRTPKKMCLWVCNQEIWGRRHFPKFLNSSIVSLGDTVYWRGEKKGLPKVWQKLGSHV